MNQLCRLCLEELKENQYIPICERELINQIFSLVCVELKWTEGLFEKLCRKCNGALKVISRFRARCKEANEWLLRVMEWQKHNVEYSRIPTETIIRILKSQSQDDPLIDPVLIKSQKLPQIPRLFINAATTTDKSVHTQDVASSTRELISQTTRSVSTTTGSCYKKDVSVDAVKKQMHVKIGTKDFETPPKIGHRSIGVATRDWFWFRPQLEDAAVTTDPPCPTAHLVDKCTNTELLEWPDNASKEAISVVQELNDDQAETVTPLKENYLPVECLDVQVAAESIICEFCAGVFSSIAEWRLHCQDIHSDQFRPFVCTLCGADFKLKDHLDIHNNVVHLELDYVECDLCGKIFFRKNDLRTHVMMHLGERKYRCTLCSARFSIKAGLTRHLAQHKFVASEEAKKLAEKKIPKRSLEQSYMCLYCGKHFTSSESRNIHEKNHSKTAINIENILNIDLLDILNDDQMSNL